MSATSLRNFFREGAPKFALFSSVFFMSRIILKDIDNKKGSKGVRRHAAMHPQKIFENLHTAVAILAVFEHFLSKFCLNCLPLNLSVSPNTMHFVRTFFIMRA